MSGNDAFNRKGLLQWINMTGESKESEKEKSKSSKLKKLKIVTDLVPPLETGALDGGLDIHHNEKRIEGHIAAYMKMRQRSEIAPVVHRNGSTNNVLLDNNMVLWLSDFRSAKMLNQEPSKWTRVAGSYGYTAPEIKGVCFVSDCKTFLDANCTGFLRSSFPP
ncbi:MDIS1-interacting receptor like kinase 2-like protein [Tanacetum coccineum]